MNSCVTRSRRLLPLAIAIALGVPAAHAATITVTTAGDAGTASTCTLRQALDSANSDAAGTSSCVAGSGDDTIAFAANLRNSTITLAGQPLSIGSNVTLNGSGQTIDANNASPVLYIDPSTTTYVSNLTITGGKASSGQLAGGIAIAPPPPKSGGVFSAKLSHRRATPIAHAPQAGSGVTLSRVTVTGNVSKYAGGLFIGGTYATLYQCTVSNNTAYGAVPQTGGGIVAYASAVLLEDSTISGNSITIGSDHVTGGIYSYDAFVILANSTLSGNSATGSDYVAGGVSQSTKTGGGKYGFAAFDATITGNNAASTGTNLTGGVLLDAGEAELINAILDGNTATTGTTPNLDVIGAGGADVQSSLLGPELQATFSGNGNVFAANPKLGPLANNGGPTLTHALLPGSPAIDAGDSSSTFGFSTDQRGDGFARIVGAAVDIGAFEVQGAAPSEPAAAPALSGWAIALLAGLFGLFGSLATRLKRR